MPPAPILLLAAGATTAWLGACTVEGGQEAPGGERTFGVEDAAPVAADTGEAAADLEAGPARDVGSPADVAPGNDAGQPDSGTAPDTASPPPPGPARYPAGRLHSPLTAAVVERLRAAAGSASRADVFAKVGDSITVSASFLRCFAGAQVDLGGRVSLRPTLDHFLVGDAAGGDPFARDSLAAGVGWSAGAVLSGDPRPLDSEVEALAPRFAVVMFGTNDIGQRNPDRYGDQLLSVIDALLAHGVVPLLSTVPARDDDPAAGREVEPYNALVRAAAQGRQVPLVDYHAALAGLPDHGLGPDGVHPTTYRPGGAGRACVLTNEGLLAGYNVRNLVTLEALDRVRRALVEGEAPPDASAPALAGDGSPDAPFVIDHLPFADLRDTATSPWRRLQRYTGCSADQDESGPEWLYRLELDRRVLLRAVVADRGDIDIDLHLLAEAGGEADCLARAHTQLEAEAGPGVFWLALDTYASGGTEHSGEYLLAVVAESAGGGGEGEPAAACDRAGGEVNAGLAEEPGDPGCPLGMVRVEAFCIDRFEAALLERRPDGSEVPWSPYDNPGEREVRAVSLRGAVPQGYIDGEQAAAACAVAGKRQCSDVEWLRACRGATGTVWPYGDEPQPGACNDARAVHPAVELFPDDPTPFDRIQDPCLNQLPDGLASTGAHPGCVSAEGAFDLAGNLHEWTADPAGTFRGGFYVDTVRNGPGCLYSTTAHNRWHWDYSTGFRCCADAR